MLRDMAGKHEAADDFLMVKGIISFAEHRRAQRTRNSAEQIPDERCGSLSGLLAVRGTSRDLCEILWKDQFTTI